MKIATLFDSFWVNFGKLATVFGNIAIPACKICSEYLENRLKFIPSFRYFFLFEPP